MSESLTPLERIRKQSDFSLIYNKGNRYRGKYFNLVYLSNDLSFSRMAAVASKKTGNAVMRNKTKRWMRALFRRNKELLEGTVDLIMIAKPGIQDASWDMVQAEYLRAIRTINRKSRTA